MSDSGEISEYDSDVEARVELGDFKYSSKKGRAGKGGTPRVRSAVVTKRAKRKIEESEDEEPILDIDDQEETPKKGRRASAKRTASNSKAKSKTKQTKSASKSSRTAKTTKKKQDSASDDDFSDADDDFVVDSEQDDDDVHESDIDIDVEEDDFEDLKPEPKKRKSANSKKDESDDMEVDKKIDTDDEMELKTPQKKQPKKAASSSVSSTKKQKLKIDESAESEEEEKPKKTPTKKRKASGQDEEAPKPKRQRKTTPKKIASAKKTSSSSADVMKVDDIVDVDALGDFAADEDEFGDAAFDEVDDKKPAIGDDELNIVLDAPEESEANPKKRKRVSDVKIRRATKEEKEAAVALHQAHLLALMGSYLVHSRAADSALLQAAVTSLVPTEAIDLFSPASGVSQPEKSSTTSKSKTKGKANAKKAKSKKATEEAADDETDEKPANNEASRAKIPFYEQEIDDFKSRIASMIAHFKAKIDVSSSLFPFDLTRDDVSSGPKSSNPKQIVFRLISKLSSSATETPLALELQEAVMAFVSLCRGMGIATRFVSHLKPVSWKLTNLTLSQALAGSSSKGPESKKMLSDLNAKDSLEAQLKQGLSAAMASLSPTPKSSADRIVINVDAETPVKADPVKRSSSDSAAALERTDTIPLEAIAGHIQAVKEEENQKNSQAKRRRKSKSNLQDPPAVWSELYCPTARKWIAVDILRALVDEPTKFNDSDEPLAYIFAFEGRTITDVTRRYSEKWSLSLRQIPDYEWLQKSLAKYNGKYGQASDDQMERAIFENKEFDSVLEKEPFPTSQEQYRHHPLYVLEKYVGKYDILWPPDQPPLGHFKNQPIFPRKNVYHLHTREKWIQHGMQVKEGEESVKKMRKITYKKNEEELKESEYYGEWQTEPYKPPPVVDGIVPTNEYGNVYLFKPEMMPIGAVKINLPDIKRLCKKLNVHFGEAVIGWEHVTGRFSKPQFDGVIVAAENKDMLLEAWQQEHARKLKEEAKKASERALKNWGNLIKLLMIKHKISNAYEKKDDKAKAADAKQTKRKSTGKATKKKGAAQPTEEAEAPASGPHEHSFPKEKWQQISDTKWLKVCACGFSVPFEQM